MSRGGIERGQAVEGQAALALCERLGRGGIERGQPVEGQAALALRERLGRGGIERSQAVEKQPPPAVFGQSPCDIGIQGFQVLELQNLIVLVHPGIRLCQGSRLFHRQTLAREQWAREQVGIRGAICGVRVGASKQNAGDEQGQ